MAETQIRIETRLSAQEAAARQEFEQLFSECPIPLDERLRNPGLFISRRPGNASKPSATV